MRRHWTFGDAAPGRGHPWDGVIPLLLGPLRSFSEKSKTSSQQQIPVGSPSHVLALVRPGARPKTMLAFCATPAALRLRRGGRGKKNILFDENKFAICFELPCGVPGVVS